MRKKAGVYAALLACIFLPLLAYLLLNISAYNVTIEAPREHFYVVSIVSMLALLLAIVVSFIAVRVRNIKVSFLSLAYLSLSALFLLIGLSSSADVMRLHESESNAIYLSVLLASFWLWLSTIAVDRFAIRWFARRQAWLLPVWSILLLIGVLVVWNEPELMKLLYMGSLSRWIILAIIIALNSWTIRHYVHNYTVSCFPLQLAMAYSTGWMMAAGIIIITGETWSLSWWTFHVLLFAAVAIMMIGMLREYWSRGSLLSTFKQLFYIHSFDWMRMYIRPSVKQLVMTTEARDAYTAGHNYRVARYALKLGEELKLPLAQLQAIMQGGLVHDVGKLSIPNQILNKPGKLTPEERAIIEEHPVAGYEICKRLGFMIEELSIIRSHHEKFNGTGYPDRLQGQEIPLLARITAIADVYDALTSTRSYRKAMTQEEAMAIIVKESGRHFDPHCVEAWKRVVAEQSDFFSNIMQTNSPVKL